MDKKLGKIRTNTAIKKIASVSLNNETEEGERGTNCALTLNKKEPG